MRPGPVADDDDPHGAALRAGLGDQASAAEAFVVRVRRDDDQASLSEALLQRRNGEPTRRLQLFAGVHSHKSIDEASCRNVHSAAAVNARSGPGCRR